MLILAWVRMVLATTGAQHRRGLWSWPMGNYKFTCCGSRWELKLGPHAGLGPLTPDLQGPTGPADICHTEHSLFSQRDALG